MEYILLSPAFVVTTQCIRQNLAKLDTTTFSIPFFPYRYCEGLTRFYFTKGGLGGSALHIIIINGQRKV